jgi:hypothetical protein
MKSTIQYLIDNNLSAATGLSFTCSDYDYIKKHKLAFIITHKGKGIREECLDIKDIVFRIKELLAFLDKFEGHKITCKVDLTFIKNNYTQI